MKTNILANSNFNNIIVMKVGPHSGMTLEDIINSKKLEEKTHGVHYWGYSGVLCHPQKVQEFCKNALNDGENCFLVLIETKSDYKSEIGFIKRYSTDKKNWNNFSKPVQLQGAEFSFVAKDLKIYNNFTINNYITVGGKNDGKPLSEHLKFRVNKSFAKLNKNPSLGKDTVLIAELVAPYSIWLSE